METNFVAIGMAIVVAILAIVILVAALKSRKAMKEEEREKDADLTAAVDDVQRILDKPSSKEKGLKMPSKKKVIVHDENRNRKLIRETKIKRLISTIENQLQPMTEETIRYLFQYDITGFHFYRWSLTEKSSEGGNVFVDENKMEAYTFLEMIQKGIPFESIDVIAYGSSAMNAVTENLRMDVNWWKYEKVCIMDPRAMDYPVVIRNILQDLECIVSGDCLLSVLEDIQDTKEDTISFRNTILYRAEELRQLSIQSEVLSINRAMKVRKMEEPKHVEVQNEEKEESEDHE